MYLEGNWWEIHGAVEVRPLISVLFFSPPERLGEPDKMLIMSVLYLRGQTQSRAGSALSSLLFETLSECIVCARAGGGPSKTATF